MQLDTFFFELCTTMINPKIVKLNHKSKMLPASLSCGIRTEMKRCDIDRLCILWYLWMVLVEIGIKECIHKSGLAKATFT